MAKKKTMWVVSSTLTSSSGHPSKCFSKDGKSEMAAFLWERFYSWDDAKEWAEEKGIELNEIQRPVQVDFSDSDMASYHNNR